MQLVIQASADQLQSLNSDHVADRPVALSRKGRMKRWTSAPSVDAGGMFSTAWKKTSLKRKPETVLSSAASCRAASIAITSIPAAG